LYVDVEDRVVELFADLAEGRIPRDARIREQDVEPPLFTPDLAEEAVEVGMVRNVAPDAGDVVPDLLDGRRQLRLTASSDEHVRAFVHKSHGRGQTYAAVSAGNERNFAFKLLHVLE